MHKCEYCGTILRTKSTLNHHKNTAKYCLNKRGMINGDFECNFCKVILSSKPRLESHLSICSEKQKFDTNKIIEELRSKYEDKISFLERELAKSQKMLENVALEGAKRPTSITTNNTKNNIGHKYKVDHLVPIKDSDFVSSVQYYTKDHAMRGVDGIVDYANTHILGKNVESIDVSRKKVLYLNEKNEPVIDDGMDELGKKIITPVQPVHAKIIHDYLTDVQENNPDSIKFCDSMIKYNDDLKYTATKGETTNKSFEKITKKIAKKAKKVEPAV